MQRHIYAGYQGKTQPAERDRIVHLLDDYCVSEGFTAQYLPKWIAVSSNEAVKGGLRTIQAREAIHSRLMKVRLRELGEKVTAEIPEETREEVVPLFSSTDHTDREKLEVLVDLFGDVEEFFRPLSELVEAITEDLLTKELLRTILDDERQSVSWIQRMYRDLSSPQ